MKVVIEIDIILTQNKVYRPVACTGFTGLATLDFTFIH